MECISVFKFSKTPVISVSLANLTRKDRRLAQLHAENASGILVWRRLVVTGNASPCKPRLSQTRCVPLTVACDDLLRSAVEAHLWEGEWERDSACGNQWVRAAPLTTPHRVHPPVLAQARLSYLSAEFSIKAAQENEGERHRDQT